MTKTSKSYLEIIAFANSARIYLEKNAERENKLCVSLRSVLKQTNKLLDEYNEQLNECQLDNCAVDEKTKVILKDEKGHLKFTVDGQKKVNKFQRELLEKSIDLHQRIRPEHDELLAGLTGDEREDFSDIVIPKPSE